MADPASPTYHFIEGKRCMYHDGLAVVRHACGEYLCKECVRDSDVCPKCGKPVHVERIKPKQERAPREPHAEPSEPAHAHSEGQPRQHRRVPVDAGAGDDDDGERGRRESPPHVAPPKTDAGRSKSVFAPGARREDAGQRRRPLPDAPGEDDGVQTPARRRAVKGDSIDDEAPRRARVDEDADDDDDAPRTKRKKRASDEDEDDLDEDEEEDEEEEDEETEDAPPKKLDFTRL